MPETLPTNPEWRSIAAQAKERDQQRCTVARLLGGNCSETLHVHHLIPVSEGGERFDLDNCVTVCAVHHPMLEALRRHLLSRRQGRVRRCPHGHRTREARRQCEARLNQLVATG